VAVPGVTPVTAPVVGFTVATPTAPLLHVPPGLELDNTVVYPVQTLVGPVIDATAGFTVTDLVEEAEHPDELVTVAV
jgi:hypothetical protein